MTARNRPTITISVSKPCKALIERAWKKASKSREKKGLAPFTRSTWMEDACEKAARKELK